MGTIGLKKRLNIAETYNNSMKFIPGVYRVFVALRGFWTETSIIGHQYATSMRCVLVRCGILPCQGRDAQRSQIGEYHVAGLKQMLLNRTGILKP